MSQKCWMIPIIYKVSLNFSISTYLLLLFYVIFCSLFNVIFKHTLYFKVAWHDSQLEFLWKFYRNLNRAIQNEALLSFYLLLNLHGKCQEEPTWIILCVLSLQNTSQFKKHLSYCNTSFLEVLADPKPIMKCQLIDSDTSPQGCDMN